ncbi:TnsD family transposase [Alteromonas ponticola]|uniref:TnsD family transposase n=1 Tax=Alteromonas aquimaris TaxID=2998417 RepID=A0ABT3P304_9ALTE|nr:TnsD family Tn7-like transposition protein [Alteromonas aquimaris]MCW8107133.1 TnsD family transposase [Alteromonas aquimaris]
MKSIPALFPDETIFSVVQRLVTMECASSYRHAAKSLFQKSSMQFSSTFPSVVPVLSIRFDCSPEYWINHHSVLPHYRPFTPEGRFRNALSHLKKGESEKVFKDLSLIANRQCSGLQMRFCPQCAIEDNDAYGFSYWHVKHQLSGAFVCLRHKTPLVNQSISRKRFDNWPCYDAAGRRLATEVELKLVRFAHYFQHHESKGFRHDLCDIFKASLHEKGFLTKCAYVRLKALRNSMIESLEPVLCHADVQAIFDDTRSPLYPTCVLSNKRSAISPLKHLLMMTFLFDSVSDLINHDISYSQKVIWANTRSSGQERDDIAGIRKALNRGDSLRNVAAETGHSVAYIKKVAISTGYSIESRAQKLFATERRQVIWKLLAGSSTETIARQFDCSQGAIEQILSQNPDVVTLRKLRRKYTKMKSMRQSLTETIRSITTPRRQDMKCENNTAYMWLYKNDRQWLYTHLPTAIPRNLRRRKPLSD